jgi:TolB-like protein
MQPPEWKRRIFQHSLQALAALAVTLAGLIVWSCYERANEPVHIAVIPFRADSADRALAAVVTDSLDDRLSRVRGFTVLRATAAADLAFPRDSARGVANSLGVRYIAIGKVQRSPTPEAPDRIRITAWLIDTRDTPPVMGEIITTRSGDFCSGVAMIAVDFAGHFARAPRGHLWGPGGVTGCAEPQFFDRRDDPTA